MAVLSLPVHPRELSLSLERRRSPQESAFSGAVQHVVGAGALWRGYIDLPPILDRDTWAECREVVRKVMSGSDRLAVPVVDGEYDYMFLGSRDALLKEALCAVNTRAAVNKSGTRLVVYTVDVYTAPNFVETAVWEQLTEEIYVTVLWHNGGPTIERAALTQADTLAHRTNPESDTVLSVTDRAEIAQLGALDPTQLYNARPGQNVGDVHSLQISGAADILGLSPPLPQMFRAATASTGGNWSTVQAQFCEPFLPALISNDDALGHTIRDRAVLPNRIEVVSSTVWP